MTTCTHCNDTGSLSKDLHGYLDCVHCEVATERAAFEKWALNTSAKYDGMVEAWQIYLHGKDAALEQAAKLIESMPDDEWECPDGSRRRESPGQTELAAAIRSLKP